MLALYGHHFSSYTWKALIALYANGTPFAFRPVDPDHPENGAAIATVSPLGKFPVLADGERMIFETTTIIEHLDRHHPGRERLLPDDPDAAIAMRAIDRVFDHYVMNVMQIVVNEHIRDGASPDQARCAEARAQLTRAYSWIDDWLRTYSPRERVTLIECAAAPSLFYADWVHPIADDYPRLQAWRAHLLALPPVKRCVDDARPYRSFFPLGAPDRD
ncbi:MAG TPA: glutathione S-transferase family protein [Novosphingobium sp.]